MLVLFLTVAAASWSSVVAAYPKAGWSDVSFTSLVTFGDSYTDESRLAYFQQNAGQAPPVGWIDPVSSQTSTGGYIWPRYVSWFTGSKLYNYAVSGAVCSNEITPRYFAPINTLFPSVLEYEVPAFLSDKAFTGPSTNITAPLDIPDDKTVYALWIGTNDLGTGAFLTDSQVKGKTIVDYLDCVYASLEKLYVSGARYFVLMNVIPLNLTPLYSLPLDGGVTPNSGIPYQSTNATELSLRMQEQVVLVNEAYKYRTPFEVKIASNFSGAQFANFDVWSLFQNIYKNPSTYLNGTSPPSVTSWIDQCIEPAGTNCTLEPSPDSYMWYNSLHPSEQTDRILAQEFVKVIGGKSGYATYWN